jgi:hypothetical protein
MGRSTRKRTIHQQLSRCSKFRSGQEQDSSYAGARQKRGSWVWGDLMSGKSILDCCQFFDLCCYLLSKLGQSEQSIDFMLLSALKLAGETQSYLPNNSAKSGIRVFRLDTETADTCVPTRLFRSHPRRVRTCYIQADRFSVRGLCRACPCS